MKRNWTIILVLALIMAPALSQAAQFPIVGPRALGMGGASVAAVNDATAVHWNPAALADFRKFEIRIPGGMAVRDHIELVDTWDRIDQILSTAQTGNPAAANELLLLLNDLNKPGTGADLDMSGGVLISIPLAKSAIAISSMAFLYAGIYPTVDTKNLDTSIASPDFIGANTTHLTGIGILAVEPAFTFATSLGEKFFIGANAKMIYTNAFVHSESLQTSGNFDSFYDSLDASKVQHDEPSFDAGVMFKPSENLSLGIVGRYLNSPSFSYFGFVAQKQPAGNVIRVLTTGEIELEPQVRAGIAWKPVSFVTLAADYDISKNKSVGIPGYEDQTVAVGAEIRLPKEFISLRAGAYKNTADDDANLVYTAGLGLRISVLRIDVAGAYDFDDKEGQVSANLAFRF